eukprot:3517743-Amphidinium_carterae.1
MGMCCSRQCCPQERQMPCATHHSTLCCVDSDSLRSSLAFSACAGLYDSCIFSTAVHDCNFFCTNRTQYNQTTNQPRTIRITTRSAKSYKGTVFVTRNGLPQSWEGVAGTRLDSSQYFGTRRVVSLADTRPGSSEVPWIEDIDREHTTSLL